MKKALKKFLIGLLIFAAIDLAIILALPLLVPIEKIAAETKLRVKEATGRDLNFSGVKLAFFPHIGVELEQVTFSNAAWAKEKNMAALEKLDVALALAPLLKKQIVIKRFTLSEPVIHLETGADGRTNWDFSGGGPVADEKAPESAGGAAGGFGLQSGGISIKDGRVTYADQKNGGVTSLENIDIEAALPDLKSVFEAKGALTYKKQRVNLALWLEKPAQFFKGETSPGRMDIKTDDAEIKAEGILATQGTVLKGTMEATIASLSKTLSWIGDGAQKNPPFEKISFTSAAQLSKTDLILKNAQLALDDVKAKGSVNVTFADKPEIFARLTLGEIDLDRFTGAAAASGDKKPSAGKDGGWDTTPIDFSGLKAVNADLLLKAEGFKLKGAAVGPSLLTVQLQDGNLHFKSSAAALFDGRFSSEVTINAVPATPVMAFAFNMTGVQAKPVLTAFADFNKLSGTADAKFSVTGSGNTEKAIISSLDGNGSVVFKNGSLEGIDLVKIAQLVQKNLTNAGIGEGRTDFVELGGTLTILNGVASNTDLKMKGPLLQATGQGKIDLPRKYIDYRVLPVLTASSGVEGAGGLSVPVNIKGNFNNIKVIPDFSGAVKKVLEDPDATKKTLKEFKKDPLKALQGLFGGGEPEPPPALPVEPVEESSAAAPPEPEPQPAPEAPPPETQPETPQPETQPSP